VVIVDPTPPDPAWIENLSVHFCATAAEIPESFTPTVIVLAVKPQIMAAVLPAYRRFIAAETVFLSIAAGKPLAWFLADHVLGGQASPPRVVRSMPNTPASVGRGMTVAVLGPGVTAEQAALCENLLQAVGAVEWLQDEALLDAVTALSGSGPAYVFLLVETMARAGMAAGLPEDLALRLARATVAGSGEMLHRLSTPAEELRRNVTSPGGTTEQALKVLMAEEGLQPLFDRAVKAAIQRAQALAGG
jgi:pyrroline-5-carboxylate reductase